MIRDLLKFEIFYQRKQRTLFIFSIIFLAYGLLIGSQNFAPANVNFNAAYQINYYTSLMSLGTVFIIMFFVISGLLRDQQYKMESLIFSTSIKKYHFILSRFLGVFIFSLLAFTPFFIGFFIGNLSPNLDPERISDFNFLAYLWPWLIFVVPSTFICAAIIFSVCLLTKNNIATYMCAISIYVVYIVCSIVLNSPLMAQSVPPTERGMMIASLADPFGIAAFFQQTMFWTPFEKNTHLVSLSGYLLWNRVIWIFAASGLLFLAYRIFTFRKVNDRIKKKKEERHEKSNTVIYKPISISLNGQMKWQAFISLLKSNLNGVFKSLPFLAIILIWIFVILSEFLSRISGGGEYHDDIYATTSTLIGYFEQPLSFFALLLIVFYSGELVNRSRDNKFDGILDATPVSNMVIFLSQLTAIALLPIILISTAIILSIGFQVSTAYFQFDLKLYASLFYFQGASLFFYSLVAVFIQSIVPQKYLGMGITASLVILFYVFPDSIGLHHPLLQLGKIPVPDYTEMNGLSQSKRSFYHLSLYWFSLGSILAMVSFKLIKRGTSLGFKGQLLKLGSSWSKTQKAAFGVLIILFVSMGSLVFYNVNVLNKYTTPKESLNLMESYERKFKQYDNLEILSRGELTTEVDLFPSDQKYRIRANYLMVNDNTVPVGKMLIQEQEKLSSIALSGGKFVMYDSLLGIYVFEFEPAIAPEQTVQMSYELEHEVVGYEQEISVVKNGTYLTFSAFEPKLGYSNSMEISSNFEREKRGLPKKVEEQVVEGHLEVYNSKMRKAVFETIVSTEGDQTAIAPGNLVKQWTDGGRNYFQYKTTSSILPAVAYFSGKYKIRKEEHNDISIEQYYYPNHNYNLDRIIESTQLTLDYCIENFGSYPFDHLRVVEVPGHWRFGGYAHPGTVSMVENRLYLADIRDSNSFDIVAKRTIHEVSHQWWGHILSPARGEGASFFVEGLAKYSEVILMEKMYGKGAVWKLSENANRRYFQGRSYTSQAESPIYKQLGQEYLAYGKNLTVMLALIDLVGEENINNVLKTVIDRQKREPDYQVNTLEFLDELYKITPNEHHQLIDDWFKSVITYDLSVEDATYEKLENGLYEVTVMVNAKRFEMQMDGSSKPIAIDEPISIGLFIQSPESLMNKKGIVYLKSHHINSNQMQFKIIVDQLPTHIAIDPFGSRSDENLFDNLLRLN